MKTSNAKKSLRTVTTFSRLNAKRFFRDKLAIFFTVIFPLIFLVIFGLIYRNNNSISFKVALINQSNSSFSQQFVKDAGQAKVLKISADVNSLEEAKSKMQQGQLDAAIVLPANFGDINNGDPYPSGEALVYYDENNQQAGQTLASVLQEQFKSINAQFVDIQTPFSVVTKSTNKSGLRQFDYAFAGLVGFAIIGLGIFGPVNVFPELKKQGILRRLHTTPLRVWQYFLSNVLSQSLIGILSIAILLAVSITVFGLNMMGNYITFIIFILISIFTIYGIGLAIGGWAKNERQAAPLGNLITFPMIFLSGTFFPRFLMPTWVQGVSDYLPLTPIIEGIRLIVTEGKTLLELGSQIGLIAVWAVIIYFIAFRVFRWE